MTAIDSRTRPPGWIGRLWEKGWIGSPTAPAAWTRALVVLVCTLATIGGVAVQWAHSTYAGALAFFDLVPVVLGMSILMFVLVFWLHGTAGQMFLFFFPAVLAAIVGGYALGNAVFAARGVVTSAVVANCVPHNDVRATWIGCTVRLPDGRTLPQQIRGDREQAGQRVTVTYDPGGLVAPAFGNRSGQNPVVLGFAGTGLALAVLAIGAAAFSGERDRRRGKRSWVESVAPQYYPRRGAARAARSTP